MIRKIGICREQKDRWERRVPLVPEDIRRLIGEHGYEVAVQGSPLRVHSNGEYSAAGALVDVSMIGLMEPPMIGIMEPLPCIEFGR